MAGGFQDYIRDEDAMVADILRDNPNLTREDLVITAQGVSIKEEAINRAPEAQPTVEAEVTEAPKKKAGKKKA